MPGSLETSPLTDGPEQPRGFSACGHFALSAYTLPEAPFSGLYKVFVSIILTREQFVLFGRLIACL